MNACGEGEGGHPPPPGGGGEGIQDIAFFLKEFFKDVEKEVPSPIKIMIRYFINNII